MKKERNFHSFSLRIGSKWLCLVILLLALLLAAIWRINAGEEKSLYSLSEESRLMEEYPKMADSIQINEKRNTIEEFFPAYRLERERIRSQELEILKTILENEDSDDKAQELLSLRMVKISEEMEKEIRLEALVKSEGIADCVALVQAETATIIVSPGALNPEREEKLGKMLLSLAGFPADKVWIKEAGKE